MTITMTILTSRCHALCREVPPPFLLRALPPFGRLTSRTRQSGEDTPPLPLLTQYDDEGRKIHAEMFARALWAGDLGGRCPFARWLLPLPRRSSIRPAEIVTARCSLNGEW